MLLMALACLNVVTFRVFKTWLIVQKCRVLCSYNNGVSIIQVGQYTKKAITNNKLTDITAGVYITNTQFCISIYVCAHILF